MRISLRGLLLCLVGGSLFGQQVLYNADLDKEGQQAATAAKALSASPITNKELQNLAVIEKQEIDGALRAGYYTMRTEIQTFDTWGRVSRSICRNVRLLYLEPGDEIAVATLDGSLSTDSGLAQMCSVEALNKQKKEYEESIINEQRAKGSTPAEDLKRAAKGVQDSAVSLEKTTDTKDKADNSTVQSSVDSAADVQALLRFASSMNGKVKQVAQIKASQEIEGGLNQLATLIDTVSGIWTSYEGAAVDPRSLAPSKDKLAASLLAIDAEKLKEKTAVAARSAIYRDELRIRLHDAVDLLNRLHLWQSSDSVEGSLMYTTETNARIHLIMALHLAAAGAASNALPTDIEVLENTIADRRAAVRRDAVYNGAYEQALQAAGQRLSAYYGSGIKPTDIAALLYYLSGIVSLPKLAF